METIGRITVWAGLIGIVIFGIVKCNDSDWYQASERERREKERADSTPHVIREADGCKVYAFNNGAGSQWHYFTKCGSTVSTERHYTESCGKNCTKQKSETIVTEGNS